ncbi:hypothetical protein DPMN_119612 [Dreissena polymorpha]|uniref:Uncharacterized protein n=1 Tax=Dreissena polymorpha TaxID=45954 RepID=A0A9D4GMP7_DREPO|nr:hypothetical protein DPMN_119612 [Dreissena polymorpha]
MKFHTHSSKTTLTSPSLVSPSGVHEAYRPPHKIDMYSPTGSSSEGVVNYKNYMSDLMENSSLSGSDQ